MIKIVKLGDYRMIETKRNTKLLILDEKKSYAWINVKDIGEILVSTQKHFATDAVLASGKYRVYTVKNEEDFTDLMHLELYVGNAFWQGYLLPTGFPTQRSKRHRIIPTSEIITRSPPVLFAGIV